MHILISNNIYPPIQAGGAELIVSYLAEGLVAHGHRVTVVSTCAPENEPYPVEMRNGVEVLRFFPKNVYWHFTRGDRPAYQKALWHLRDAWNSDAGKRFKVILQNHKPDILHTHLIDGFSGVLWRRAKQASIPVIHTAHDYHLICPRALLLTRDLKICTNPRIMCQVYRWWHKRTARDIDIFCSPSRFLIEKHREAGLTPLHTAVVANGIPLPSQTPKIPPRDNKTRFLFAARLAAEKGCEVVLNALQYLPTDLNFELVIAGKGAYEDAFRALVARDKRVKFLGYIQAEQKKTVFESADYLIIPSLWYENAPVVIVEAAAYHMGVIGSRIGAIPEFVEDGETGLLFEPGNPAALAAVMRRVIENPGLRTQFATKAQNLVVKSSVESMIEAYLTQYQTALTYQAKEA